MKLLLVIVLGMVVNVMGMATQRGAENRETTENTENAASELLILEQPDDALSTDDLAAHLLDAQKILKQMPDEVRQGTTNVFNDTENQPDYYDTLAESSGRDAVFKAVNTRQHAAVLAIKKPDCPANRWYHCDHTTYILYWFLLRDRCGNVHSYCYVPWGSLHQVTYAKCDCDTCKLAPRNGQSRLGRCRPSCYQRRRLLVWCYHVPSRRWYRKWETRSLPQSCACAAKPFWSILDDVTSQVTRG